VLPFLFDLNWVLKILLTTSTDDSEHKSIIATTFSEISVFSSSSDDKYVKRDFSDLKFPSRDINSKGAVA
jgi:hypothetical protein